MKRSGNVFPSDMIQGQYISPQRSRKVKATFFTIWFVTDNFWTMHDRDKIRTASCSSRQDAYTDIHVDIKRSGSKYELRSRSRRDPSCISVEAYWWDKHIETTFMSLALLNLKLSAKNCWWPRVTSDEFNGVTDQHLTLGHHAWPKSTWSWKNCALLMRWEADMLRFNFLWNRFNWPSKNLIRFDSQFKSFLDLTIRFNSWIKTIFAIWFNTSHESSGFTTITMWFDSIQTYTDSQRGWCRST